MKNFKIVSSSVLFSALVLTSCGGGGPNYPKVSFWHNFGSSYTQTLNRMLAKVEESIHITPDAESQGSYDKLQTNMMASIATRTFPTLATGYPDHFAGYLRDGIQLSFDDDTGDLPNFVEEYNEEYQTDILADYYDEYMVENKALVAGHVVGLPFNKSTEVLCYNSDLVEYLWSQDATITKSIPATWDAFRSEGPKYLVAIHNLFGHQGKYIDEDTGEEVEGFVGGKLLYGKTGADGHCEDFEVRTEKYEVIPEGWHLVVDFQHVGEEEFNLLMWDATDNMFITIVRQWGATYTSYTEKDQKSSRHGYAEFWNAESEPKTRAALEAIYDLHANNGVDDESVKSTIFSVTDGYNSDAFKAGKCLFTVGSSGGLSYNLPTTNAFRVRVAPIPYHEADKKYVISQGTNIGIFDQGDDETLRNAFKVAVALTTGEIQGEWAARTGYYPASKSATNSKVYQSLLNDEQTTPQFTLYQDSAKLNQGSYMNTSEGWTKFVDAGFVGSSFIRTEVKPIIGIILNGMADINKGDKTLTEVIDETMAETLDRIDDYIRK